MIGVFEVALFLTPFVLYAAWRLLVPLLPMLAVWIALGVVGVVVLAGAWGLSRPHMQAGQLYAPARLHDGRVAPGHAVAP